MKILSKNNRIILAEMVRTDFKLRYQSSVLGYLWSLLRPLLLSAILYIVFVKFLGLSQDIRHYASYLLLGIMVWTFFVEVTNGGVGAVVGKGDLIRKIAIPRYLTVLSSSASALINLLLNLAVLVTIMIFSGVEVQTKFIILVPFLLIELYLFSLAIAFFLSATFVKFRDIAFIWDVFSQLLFYLTPIIYPISMLVSKYRVGRFALLNPLAQIIQDLRHILVTPQSQTAWQLIRFYSIVPIVLSVALCALSVLYFRREAKYFAENV
jgi:ABC-2 type transport system permease protein